MRTTRPKRERRREGSALLDWPYIQQPRGAEFRPLLGMSPLTTNLAAARERDVTAPNRRAVLSTLLKGERLSRIDIARHTGLAPASVNRLASPTSDRMKVRSRKGRCFRDRRAYRGLMKAELTLQ